MTGDSELIPLTRAFAPRFLLLWGLAACLASDACGADPVQRLDFTRDVRPILANHCWNCHGPDEEARKAGLRLDQRDAALRPSETGTTAIVPKRPADSELIVRIESDDAELRMPPESFGKPLTARQKEVLKQWIASGAEYAEHWAFSPPVRPAVPRVAGRDWPRNPLDVFVLRRLEDEGLKPSSEADRATWLRRVTLDLTGLSPTPEDLEAFLADTSAESYERVVDRLLISPRHAERMAMQWLDAARFADTNGYNNDEVRTMWPWRDWLIRAFQQGMPYDQFVVEQLAGDLIPDATLAQKVATGFNRNHVLTTEGGIIEEEYHVEYVADRVHTTATVFLGLSLQCARCHDHKYDPLTQKDYYRFAAYFNNVPDKVVGYSAGRMAEPLLKVPSPEQQAEQARLEARRAELARLIPARATAVDADLAAWEQSLTPEERNRPISVGLAAQFSLDETQGEQVRDSVDTSRSGTIRGKIARGPGKLAGSLTFDGSTFVEVAGAGAFEADQKFSLAAWFQPDSNDPSTILSKIDEGNAYRGYDLIVEQGRVAAHFVDHWPDRGFKVITKEPVSLKEWHHVLLTYNGSRRAAGVRMYIDGKSVPLEVTTDKTVEGSLATDKPFHIGRRSGSAEFKGKIDHVQLYAVELGDVDASALAEGQPLRGLSEVLAVASTERTPEQRAQVRQYYLDRVDPVTRQFKAELGSIPQQLAELDKTIPVTMVMTEMEPRRTMHVLRRGQYDQPGEAVQPGPPTALSAGLTTEIPTRLELAKWLTSPSHPLTSRVAVNRLWEMVWGTGLVETVEDFGVQGAPASHPELLDWLATELVARGWDQRAILKLIVLSSAYRQASHAAPALLERDPANRLLARGPRYRLPVEVVRDNALAMAGLLASRVGGPSVRPYQPEGLWEDVSVERRDKYTPDSGESLYRRSMYTFWKRTCPPPAMTAFDAPDRETCTIRRARTNTPLQALVLLNDPTYVEAARVIAERVLARTPNEEQRLKFAVQLAVTRAPRPEDITVLKEILSTARENFQKDPAEATQLLSVGQARPRPGLDPVELATWTTLTSVLLNLDETISQH